ncbi:MAG: ABC transporter ATP-binding protein [Kiloniellales bacterium]
MPILEVENLTMRFGGLTAVDKLSFSVEEGAIHGLIGPNGAGKTTTFNAISGFYRPTGGRVLYRGQDISGLRTSRIAELGLVRTFQATVLFHEFSVLDNVLVGCHLEARGGFLSALFGLNRTRESAVRDRAEEILAVFDLAERRDELASNLPHGLQRALGVAVALAADPKVLLLDEPFTGMNPEETRHMMKLLQRVSERGVTLLLVEHDMQAVMGLCGKITVLSFGSLLAEGTPEAIRKNQQVIEAYLGTADYAA